MRWIKHMTRTRNDQKMATFLTYAGLNGYGFWWALLETIASEMDNSDRCEICYTVYQWCSKIGCKKQTFLKYIQIMQDLDLLTASQWPADGQPLAARESTNGSTRVSIKVSNLLKYRDEYSSRSGHSPDKLPTKKQKQNNIPPIVPQGGQGSLFGLKAPDELPEREPSEVWFEDEFWPLYPRKVAKAAAKRSAKRHGDTAEKRKRILGHLKSVLPLWSEREERHIPHASTWLNSEDWDDMTPQGVVACHQSGPDPRLVL